MPETVAKDDRFSRWPWWRKWFGQRSERAVAKFLRRLGWRILGRNLADARGEIDLLALDGSTLVIVEVRSTESKSIGEVAASVDLAKQKRLTLATLRFFHRRRLKNIAFRFDVIIVRWPPNERHPEIRHFRSDFETTGRFQMHS